jgi:uncharacterized protein (TIGR04255 family)
METFTNPPITEALIDIRAELPSDITISDLEKLHEKIESCYPKKRMRQRWEADIKFTKQEGARAESKNVGPDGYLFESADDRQIVQYRLDGFTFNRLRPYKNWETMRSEAKQLWDLWVEGVKPLLVTRLALRYINSIDIPEKPFSLEEYFTAPPRVPAGLSSILEGFLSRIVIGFPETASKAILTQAIQPPKSPNVASILLDSDVYREVRLPGNAPEIWPILEDLRHLKNEIFDKSLTEKTKERFR